MATADATIREGSLSVGEASLPLNQTDSKTASGASKQSSTRSSLPVSNSTGEGPYMDALGALTSNDSAPAPEPMICPTLVVPDDYFPDGEPPRTGSAEAHVVRSPKSLEKPQNERVLILAANSGGSCQLQLGDYYNFLSLLDKLQYGNVHGYDVMLGMGNVDDDLRKTWNKVAWMLKVCTLVPVTSFPGQMLSDLYKCRSKLVKLAGNRTKCCMTS